MGALGSVDLLLVGVAPAAVFTGGQSIVSLLTPSQFFDFRAQVIHLKPQLLSLLLEIVIFLAQAIDLDVCLA